LEIKSETGRLDESIEATDVTGTARARAPISRSPVTPVPPPPPKLPRSVSLATKHAKWIVGVWLAFALVLGVLGLFAKQVLHPEDLIIRGTPSAKALQLDQQSFGKSTPLAIMLTGPQAALDSAGPKLVKDLNAIPGVSVGSPWSAGAPVLMRQSPTRALLIASISDDVIGAGRETLPKINAELKDLPPTIDSRVAGESRFSTELVNLVFAGALKAEILAFPFLLIILLLIFRAPIAAAIPLIMGLAVIGVTTGFVTALGLLMPVNILAQASGSIIGLALGVDYSLLFVSRFREELARTGDVKEAVAASMKTAGRTVAYAGGILVLAGLVVIAVSFGWASMTTGTIGVISAAVFSVLAAFTLLPACLVLFGHQIDRWSIARKNRKPFVAPLVNKIINRPLVAAIAALIPLLILCYFALGLQTGGPDLKMFKADNPMRADTQKVADVYGGGVMAPYEVIAKSSKEPITAPSDIRALGIFQQAVANDPAVASVVGLGTSGATKLANSTEKAPGDLAKLDVGLGAASTGAQKLRKGVKSAGGGASNLAAGNSSALAGARQLQAGVGAAAAGANELSAALSRTANGSRQLDSSIASLVSGAKRLQNGTRRAQSTADGFIKEINFLRNLVGGTASLIDRIQSPQTQAIEAIDSAVAALDSLPSASQSDPAVQSARSSLNSARSTANSAGGGVAAAAAQNQRTRAAVAIGQDQAYRARDGINELDSGVDTLVAGTRKIASGTNQLTNGLGKLSTGSGALASGLNPLSGGSQALANGLGSAATGSDSLAKGLSSGDKRSAKLTKGLSSAHTNIAKLRAQANAQGRVDPKRVGKSPYLTMALLSAAPQDQKRNLGLVLNEQQGGTATRAYVLTKETPTDKSIASFNTRLTANADKLGKDIGATVAVGGQGRTFLDYDLFTNARIWVLIAALSLMSFIFLLFVFRSVLLAAKAVVLNLITVGAAMGLVALLYGGENPFLGGPGWMEATSFFVVYSTTFALSMDYEIFMINRMRESYLEHGDNDRAIREGVTKTASIVTGSAAVMIVLFIAMAYASDLISNAQLGLGLAFAVAIDATVVRLVLLPATMRMFGAANWWVPAWMDRRLPAAPTH
jgi:RND superfamily putative drug exporter